MNKELTIFTDGGARGNPGPAGIGIVAYNQNKEIVFTISEYIGKTTNNQAEYRAVIAALEKSKDLGVKKINFFIDSELAVKQLNREYKVKDKGIASLFLKIYNIAMNFEKITYTHIRRERNKEADALVNKALDRELKG